MKLISVHGGHFAKVDDEDFDMLSQMRWHAMRGVSTVYAATNVKRENGRYGTVAMHRIVNKTPHGLDTDHIDGDGLNNIRANLRIATRTENGRNRAPNRGGTSAAKGVYWNKRKRRWIASIRVNKVLVFLGQHRSEDDAAAAYANAAKQYFGEFARTENGDPQ